MNMKNHLLRLGATLALLALALPGSADVESVDETKVDETKDVRADGLVSINVVRSLVRIETWDKLAVRVHGTLDEKTKEFIFDVDGKETVIEVKIDGDHDSWLSGRTESSNLTIQLPATSEVGVRGVSTDVEARGLGSDVEIGVVSGSIRLRLGGDINARFDVETGSGNIRNRLSDDQPKVSKYVGDESLRFTLGEGDSRVTLSTRSGDISLSGN